MAEEPGPERDLLDAFREVGTAGRSGVAAVRQAGESLRALVAADIALARNALGRAATFIAVAIVFGATAWLLLMAALVGVLVSLLHWSWPLALFVVALVNLAVTALAAWRAAEYFEHTGMKATRRQLARLGIGGERDDEGDGSEQGMPR